MKSSRSLLPTLFASFSLTFAIAIGGVETEPTAGRPNVVLILIDDMSHYGVTAYGSDRMSSNEGLFENAIIATPNIDRLAREGFIAEQAFTYPLCENTRVALMSAKYNKRNYLRPKSLHQSDITFGDVFQRAGYRTGLFGKWKQTRGTPSIPAKDYIYEFGWDEFTAFDVVGEPQRFINPGLVINGVPVSYAERADVDPETGRRWYGPDIVNRNALDFIERNRDVPFFLYYSMMLIHDEHQPTPDTQPPSLFDEFDEVKDHANGRYGDDRRYLPDMIAYTDKLIGQVIEKLEAEGLREKTLIIVMGDNGTKETFTHVHPDGSVYPGRKGGNADNGLHVPLAMSMPGTIPAGDGIRTYPGLVHVTDIFPTMAEAAGITIPHASDIDGISFWSQAVGGPGEPRRTIHHWYINNYTYKDVDKAVEYAFDHDFKRYAPSPAYPEGRFFDLRTDPLERVGETVKEFRWGVLRYSGLPLDTLTPEQEAAYERLGEVIDRYQFVDLETIDIEAADDHLGVGQTLHLTGVLHPVGTTRNGTIWVSSDPSIVRIDKFGRATAVAPGQATITLYSWDDAEPLANGQAPEYLTNGKYASLLLTVH